MAERHQEILEAGTRVFGVSVDSARQNAAMIEKLRLPFPLLSDPDRSACIDVFGVADPTDERRIAKPAMILLDPEGQEVWRFVSRDFADRLPEDEVIEQVRSLGLGSVAQAPPSPGDPSPGPHAMPVDGLLHYLRGARFAALAMGLRHGHLDPTVKEDSKAYVAEMDRFAEALKSRFPKDRPPPTR